MKVNIIDDYDLIVFFNRFYTKNIDFTNKTALQHHLHKLFLKLKNNYNLKLIGYYNVNIYLDKHYGAVLEIQKEDIEYFDCFDNQIDMRVNIIEDSFFLYKIKDPLNLSIDILNSNNLYIYEKRIYLEITKDIPEYILGQIIENTTLIYNEITETIKKRGKKLKLEPKI